MCKSLRKVLEECNEELFSRLSRDYLTALVGLDLHKTESGSSSTSPKPKLAAVLLFATPSPEYASY